MKNINEISDTINIGMQLYKNVLRHMVETEENIGKPISIDVNTGEYEIDSDVLQAGLRMRARRPNGNIYGMRIGYNTLYAVGGSLHRVTYD